MATIDTNMSLVMIDPNEPLELYDGTIIKGRLEWFLYALCCLDYGNFPTPLSRIEEWANALITNELPNMEPQSRAEEFFKAILTGDTSNLPTPQSRSEVLLDKLARGENDFTNVEKIQSRYEFLLAYLIKNGGGIGNIDYVLYKFQKEDETLYNTKERPVKSAILKGCTKYTNDNGDVFDKFFTPIIVNWSSGYVDADGTIADGGHYVTQFIDIAGFDGFNFGIDETRYAKIGFYDENKTFISRSMGSENGTHGIVMSQTFPPNTKYIRASFTTKNVYFKDFYNRDLTLPLSLSNVKMPVLTTTGKNLFDGELEYGGIDASTGNTNTATDRIRSKNFIKTNSQLITVSRTNADGQLYIYEYNENKTFIRLISGGSPQQSFKNVSLSTNAKYIKIADKSNDLNSLIQIEESSIPTPYESYKSNILSCNEEVTLRGIGDVKDTLDCLTGELTECIGEIVLDGSEGVWSNHSGLSTDDYDVYWSSNGFVPSAGKKILSDKLKYSNPTTPNTFRINDSGGLFIGVNKGVNIRDYLSQNTPKIQYDLTEPVVKTVDLSIVDQGGATIPKLNTFDKITHVNVSATDILPGVEMEVATTVGEDLSGTLYSTMEDIETKQEVLKESNNAQTESINSTMMATTEIYESLL